MNSNSTTIIVAAVVVVALLVIISVVKKALRKSNTSNDTAKPVEQSEIVRLRESISPIMNEIETQRMAGLINYWSDKFANNRLTVADVESLNALIAAGSVDQVNGILAVHPNGRKMFNNINDDLRMKSQDSLAKVNAENAEALV